MLLKWGRNMVEWAADDKHLASSCARCSTLVVMISMILFNFWYLERELFDWKNRENHSFVDSHESGAIWLSELFSPHRKIDLKHTNCSSIIDLIKYEKPYTRNEGMRFTRIGMYWVYNVTWRRVESNYCFEITRRRVTRRLKSTLTRLMQMKFEIAKVWSFGFDMWLNLHLQLALRFLQLLFWTQKPLFHDDENCIWRGLALMTLMTTNLKWIQNLRHHFRECIRMH